MAKQTPVAYAEGTLGVHDVYEQSLEAHKQLEAALGLYADAAASIREINGAIEAREYDLVAAHRGENPDISLSALDRWLKDQRHADDSLRELRDDLLNKQADSDSAHVNIEKYKYRLRVLSARMNELGGLLNFFASAKMAAQKRPEPSQSDS